jgi:hypothetical protein
VVRDTSGGQVFVGTITRSHLTALLQKLVAARHQRGGTSGTSPRLQDLSAPLPEVGAAAPLPLPPAPAPCPCRRPAWQQQLDLAMAALVAHGR